MSYLVVKPIQIAAAVAHIIRHFLNNQKESVDLLIVYGNQKVTIVYNMVCFVDVQMEQ